MKAQSSSSNRMLHMVIVWLINKSRWDELTNQIHLMVIGRLSRANRLIVSLMRVSFWNSS
jgi:hypothetical protein